MNGLIPQFISRGLAVLVDPGAAPQWGIQRAWSDGNKSQSTIVVTEPSSGAAAAIGNLLSRIDPPDWNSVEAERIEDEVVTAIRSRGPLLLTDDGYQRLGELVDGRTSDPCITLHDLEQAPDLLLSESPSAVRSLVAEGLVASPQLPTSLVNDAQDIQSRHPIALYSMTLHRDAREMLTTGTPINDEACRIQR